MLLRDDKIKVVTNTSKKKIWIDLDNSPHVPFFRPIIKELRQRGYPILVTARDCFQVCGLADLLEVDYIKIGRHYGKRSIFKIYGLFWRSLQLAPIIIRHRPILALSHGSRSQLLLAAFLMIDRAMIMDYEYVHTLPFIHLRKLILPEVVAKNSKYRGVNNVACYP